jgi:23S rRNA (uracil1939-C5)-methyltransferase
LSPPNSRRRATLKALKVGQGAVLGFNEEKSHRIIDMRECHILRLELFALVQPLRELFARLLDPKRGAEAQLTLIDQGADVTLRNVTAEGLSAIEALTDFATAHRLARLSVDSGNGPETVYEPVPASVTLSGIPVAFPNGASFRLPRTARRRWWNASASASAGPAQSPTCSPDSGRSRWRSRPIRCRSVARFGGCAKRAAPATTVEHRDLYRRPLDAGELKQFAPSFWTRLGPGQRSRRAARRLGCGGSPMSAATPRRSPVMRKTLVDGGYRLEWVRPVGQFRWSTHVELAACFSR